MYAKAKQFFRVEVDYEMLEDNVTGQTSKRTMTLGPFETPSACKGAVTRAKKEYPLHYYYTPQTKQASQRISRLYEATIHDVRIQVCEPVWKEYKV